MGITAIHVIWIRDLMLRSFCQDLLVGVPAAHAFPLADSLVASNLRGIDSHGVELLTGGFGQRAGRLVDMMKESEPRVGFAEVMVAGEPAWRTEAERRLEGSPAACLLWKQLSEIGARLNLPTPTPDVFC
jgi:LDH2 family malate/lactate/ureidoglycolate dehydrogenase